MYLQAKRRRGGLGQLIAPDLVSPLVSAFTPSTTPSCSTWDFFFNDAAWQACQRGLEVAQIQSVPANAAAAGYSPDVVAVAQATANEQSGFAPADVSNISTFYGAGQLVTPAAIPTWLYVVGAIAGGLLVMSAFK